MLCFRNILLFFQIGSPVRFHLSSSTISFNLTALQVLKDSDTEVLVPHSVDSDSNSLVVTVVDWTMNIEHSREEASAKNIVLRPIMIFGETTYCTVSFLELESNQP